MSAADSAELQTKEALLASAPLLALVPSGKITPDDIDEASELPAICYERGSTAPEGVLDDPVVASRVSMNILIWATSRKSANEVAVAVTAAMHEAGHAQTERDSEFEPELRQHAAVLTFDVWELPET